MDDSQLAALAKAAAAYMDDPDAARLVVVQEHRDAWSPERALAALAVIEAAKKVTPVEQWACVANALIAWDALAKGSEG